MHRGCSFAATQAVPAVALEQGSPANVPDEAAGRPISQCPFAVGHPGHRDALRTSTGQQHDYTAALGKEALQTQRIAAGSDRA